MAEVVATFKSENRTIAMYFKEEEGALNMQMSVDPEFKEGDDPDLTMLLAGAFLDAINTKNEDDKPEIITTD